MKIDERRPRQLCCSLSLRGLTLLSFESQRLMCLSRCLSCLPHYPLDPLSLGLFPLLQCLSSPPLPLSRTDKARQAEIKRQDRTRPTRTRPHKVRPDKGRPAVSSRLSASRFACPTRYDDLASSSDNDDEPSSPVCSQLSMPADPFSALRTPPHCLGISRLVRSRGSARHCSFAFRAASTLSPHPYHYISFLLIRSCVCSPPVLSTHS
jgi:hypothetical protein